MKVNIALNSNINKSKHKKLPKKWNPEKIELYHHHSVEDILENISVEFIDNIVEKISDVLVESAKNAFGQKPVFTNTSETFNFKY